MDGVQCLIAFMAGMSLAGVAFLIYERGREKRARKSPSMDWMSLLSAGLQMYSKCNDTGSLLNVLTGDRCPSGNLYSRVSPSPLSSATNGTGASVPKREENKHADVCDSSATCIHCNNKEGRVYRSVMAKRIPMTPEASVDLEKMLEGHAGHAKRYREYRHMLLDRELYLAACEISDVDKQAEVKRMFLSSLPVNTMV